jgi:hypothetical protein
MRTWAEAEHSFLPPLPEKWALDRRCPVSSIRGEVKKKHFSAGWKFSCFAAHIIEQDLY